MAKDKLEADGLVEQFLIDLTTDEQRELLAFMQGFKLAKGLDRGRIPAAVPMA